MKNDLPDIELYHRELLYNLELRLRMKDWKQNKRTTLSLLDDIDPIEDEDKEFAKSYIRSCGVAPQR